jgi:dolichol-phosphate mannosyltransferase
VNLTNRAEFISIVIPACDEAQVLPTVISRITSVLDTVPVDFEIRVVDDGSRDETWAEIIRLGESEPRVRGIRLSRNFGHQAALLCGLRSARGDAVITMDADGEHPPELLSEFVRLWRSGALVVQGVRSGDWSRSRAKRLSSRVFYRLLGLVSDTRVEPGTADFRLLDRKAADCVAEIQGQTMFLRGLVPWLGLPTEYVQFDPGQRIAGKPSYSLSRMARLSLDGLLSSTAVPLRIVALTGLTSAIAALLFLVYVIAVRFLNGQVVAGWASVAGLIALLGGIQLLALGVLGEYIGRLFTGSLGRPQYVVLDRTGTPGDEPLQVAVGDPSSRVDSRE